MQGLYPHMQIISFELCGNAKARPVADVLGKTLDTEWALGREGAFDEHDMLDASVPLYWGNNDGTTDNHQPIAKYSEDLLVNVHRLLKAMKRF